MGNVIEGTPGQEIIRGIRDTNEHPMLGLQSVRIESAAVDRKQVDEFIRWLCAVVESGGGFDRGRTLEELPAVAGSCVRWQRLAFQLYPVYVEQLRITDDLIAPRDGKPSGLSLEGPGQWAVSAAVLGEGGQGYRSEEDIWRSFIAETVKQGRAAGGFSLNLLEIPSDALRRGEIDVRPLALHALDESGAACDRGNTRSQAAIANAFWQTFWATGALRSQRGATFPVGFLPIDRASVFEFEPPFGEKWVSLRRRLFGRSSILAFICEALTRDKALLFDRERNAFVIAGGFSPGAHGIGDKDVCLAVHELNRTGFVDAYIGANSELFAGWRQHEDSPGVAVPWDARSAEAAVSGADSIQRMRIDCDRVPDSCIRIHRIVPFSGCAFLSEVVNETSRLAECGKIRGLDDEILGATNSTFFLNFPEEYATLHSAMNDPVALLVENGRTLQVRTMRRAAFVLGEDGTAEVTCRAGIRLNSEALMFEAESLSATYFEKATRSFSDNTVGPVCFGAVVVGDSIVETFEETTTEVPSNGWVTGDSEAIGGEIDPRHAVAAIMRSADGSREIPIRHALAVGPMLVENGRIVALGDSREEFQPIVLRGAPSFEEGQDLPRTGLAAAFMDCEKRGVPPTRFPYDWNRTRAPRSAIGIRVDGSVLLVVADGRADLGHSVGATLAELAQLMLNLGCVSAMNMDGGGSSVMFVHDPQVHPLRLRNDLREGVVNLPSDLGGVERLLPVPLVVSRRRGQS